ncbi:nucleotidyltransferase family protein [Roseateles sp. GG27B]
MTQVIPAGLQAGLVILLAEPQLTFAVPVGSRTTGTAHAASDWDIALQWAPQLAWMDVLAKTEVLRSKLAQAMTLDSTAIDLIDLHRANLAMRATVAEEGVILRGHDTLEWAHFLNRTWRDLEYFYWPEVVGYSGQNKPKGLPCV